MKILPELRWTFYAGFLADLSNRIQAAQKLWFNMIINKLQENKDNA